MMLVCLPQPRCYVVLYFLTFSFVCFIFASFYLEVCGWLWTPDSVWQTELAMCMGLSSPGEMREMPHCFHCFTICPFFLKASYHAFTLDSLCLSFLFFNVLSNDSYPNMYPDSICIQIRLIRLFGFGVLFCVKASGYGGQAAGIPSVDVVSMSCRCRGADWMRSVDDDDDYIEQWIIE